MQSCCTREAKGLGPMGRKPPKLAVRGPALLQVVLVRLLVSVLGPCLRAGAGAQRTGLVLRALRVRSDGDTHEWRRGQRRSG